MMGESCFAWEACCELEWRSTEDLAHELKNLKTSVCLFFEYPPSVVLDPSFLFLNGQTIDCQLGCVENYQNSLICYGNVEIRLKTNTVRHGVCWTSLDKCFVVVKLNCRRANSVVKNSRNDLFQGIVFLWRPRSRRHCFDAKSNSPTKNNVF